MRFIAMLFMGLMLLATGGSHAQEAGSGWLGAEMKDLTKEDANALGWEAPRGAKMVKPLPGGPAEAAGLQAGDILLSLDGVEIENAKSFIATLGTKAAGTEIKLAISRAGREKRLGIKLAARPAQFAATKTKAAEAGPAPMLDSGGHMALINAIAFTPDGTQLVSASDDKTIRVWDVATGKTVRTIRGEVEPGDTGKIFAAALSPDGKWLAAGGWFCPSEQFATDYCEEHIRLYDFASGKLVALLKGHGDVVERLAFSPDGRHLISGSQDKTAIIWDVAARKVLHRLKGHRAEIYAVSFTSDGARAVTGSYDHELRLWQVDSGALLHTMTGHGDRVRGLAVAPDGRIVSGDFSGEIRLWDGRTGAFLKTLARQKTGVGSLSFSPDGKLLLSGIGEGSNEDCHVYDAASGREIVTYKGHNNIVLATAVSPDGRWAATGGGNDEAIHIWELRNGERRKGPDGQPLTLGGTGRDVFAAGFSADGRIAWGNADSYQSHNERGPFEYALTLPSGDAPLTGPFALSDSATPNPALSRHPLPKGKDTAFVRATTQYGGWSLRHRKGGNYGGDAILDISKGGKVVASIKRGPAGGYQHRAYSFTPDGETIISGGDGGTLTAYDRAGNTLGDFIGHDGDVWAVTPSPAGRYLVTGSADQTLRLWNLKTRELLVTLFQGTDGEWVMWTPQGYYAASGPGAEMIGWQINHGPENAVEYVTAAQLRKSLNRPDIVTRAIQLASADAAVKEAYGASFKLADLLAKPVPHFRIVSPAANATVQGGKTEVEIALEATPDPVKAIRIQVNGTQIAEHQPADGPGFKAGTQKFTVPLANGRNTVRLVAVNDTGETPAEVLITHDGNGDLNKRGTLYILAIGIDKYPNMPRNDLRFSGADAKAFAETMAKRVGPSHDKVVSRVLVNGASPGDTPTAANILNALSMLRQANENDTVMVFVAGHGANEGRSYRLLATDTAWQEGGGYLPATVVPWYALQEAIESAKGRRILFLDTCHSGNAYNQRLGNDSYQANIIVYSASRWDQEAQERSDLGHGLFTFATVEGVEGKAGALDGQITTLKLRDYLVERVRELIEPLGKDQEPQYFRGRDAENYVLVQRK